MTSREIVERDMQQICTAARDAFDAMRGHRLLITGGAGFLGYSLVQAVAYFNAHIAGAGDKIDLVVTDNFSRGAPDWLTQLGESKQLALVKHDARDPLADDMRGFDFAMHAASIASPTVYRRDPLGTMDANINGLRNLLEEARHRQGGARPVHAVLFFSSSEIYGDPEPECIPTPETYTGRVSCTGPRACYDEAKRFGETLCVGYFRQHGVPIKAARPFNNYGPGLRITDGRVIPDFARDVLNNRDIVMLSDGRATRTFCYVADAAAGYFKTLVQGRAGEAYNIGTETPEIAMRELAESVAAIGGELYGYSGKVVTKASDDSDYLVDNPNRRCPVINKARLELGYDPSVTLDDGLRRSLLWYGDHRDSGIA